MQRPGGGGTGRDLATTLAPGVRCYDLPWPRAPRGREITAHPGVIGCDAPFKQRSKDTQLPIYCTVHSPDWAPVEDQSCPNKRTTSELQTELIGKVGGCLFQTFEPNTMNTLRLYCLVTALLLPPIFRP